ncbi:MAG TPA: prolipoprotein diacylglyceryl transferase family protein [Phycisphaerae bacterium]|nr:prolipoprotein diacylglyceryl transferase family protein [Phycisphaerae bacterium]
MYPDLCKLPFVNITVPSFGAVVMLGFLLATFWAGRRCSKVKLDPDMALNLGFIILIFGTVSARAFYVIHYWESEFAHQPSQILNIRAGGMEVYGGLIGGFLASAAYIKLKRQSLRLLADIVAPSLLLAMGMGRIGCFLFGCCWGVPSSENLPWAVRFPFSSPAYQQQWEERLITAPAELILVTPDGLSGPMPRQLLAISEKQLNDRLAQFREQLEKTRAGGDADKIAKAEKKLRRVDETIQPLMDHLAGFDTSFEALRVEADQPARRTLPVHPAQLYSAVGPIVLAFLTSAFFYRRARHGTVILLGMSLYALERFIEETVRLDNPQDTLGLTVSQAISLGVLVLAGISYLILRRLPLRSPFARSTLPAPK